MDNECNKTKPSALGGSGVGSFCGGGVGSFGGGGVGSFGGGLAIIDYRVLTKIISLFFYYSQKKNALALYYEP